jgi:hypothetical protein
MRKEMFLAVPAAGLFFFGAGALLLALTDPTLGHWYIAFWVGVICTPLGLVNLLLLLVWEMSPPSLRKKRPKLGPVLLINTAMCMAVAGFVWHFWPILPEATSRPSQPDVTLRFVYPESPTLVLENLSDKTAQNIKWTVVLWNLDDPRAYSPGVHAPDIHEPLQIPIATFDFIRPHSLSGPQNLFASPLVAPYVKLGNRFAGSASTVCPECSRGHTFLVYIILGEGGWYSEVSDITNGDVVIPPKLTKSQVLQYASQILNIPNKDRTPITGPQFQLHQNKN